MKTERNKALTEAMGECWHEVDMGYPRKSHGLCTCGEDFVSYWGLQEHLQDGVNNDFSTWTGCGFLIESRELQSKVGIIVLMSLLVKVIQQSLDSIPDRFADAVCAFLKDMGEP
jgi:hypothetical protein